MNIRHLRTDRAGGIEGLPLQLMIVILVATMGTAIIVGWMGNIETPHSIGDVGVEDIVYCNNGQITGFSVEVRDQDGNYLEGAVVIIENSYITMDDGAGGTKSAPCGLYAVPPTHTCSSRSSPPNDAPVGSIKER